MYNNFSIPAIRTSSVELDLSSNVIYLDEKCLSLCLSDDGEVFFFGEVVGIVCLLIILE
jgi:hypothetical protein